MAVQPTALLTPSHALLSQRRPRQLRPPSLRIGVSRRLQILFRLRSRSSARIAKPSRRYVDARSGRLRIGPPDRLAITLATSAPRPNCAGPSLQRQ